MNIYDSSCLTERRPKPLKSVMNLTSACTTLKFNPASEMLCALSSHSEQAVKMVKKTSLSVYNYGYILFNPNAIMVNMSRVFRANYSYAIVINKSYVI